MVVVSTGHVGGTRGSGIVSSAADVLWMVRGMRSWWSMYIWLGAACVGMGI